MIPCDSLTETSIKAEPDHKPHKAEFQSVALDEATDLVFEKETSIQDFEREPVYDVDNFEKKSIKVERMLTPPPDFQDALKRLPQCIQEEFKRTLNADIVGIWPIKSNILLSKNTLSDTK